MKTFQRFLGIALTMLLMAAFPSTANADYSETELAAMQAVLSDHTVFLRNTSWGAFYCHCWDNSGNTTGTPQEMTIVPNTTNIYYYSASFAPTGVLFCTDTSYSNSTGNLTWNDGGYYESGSYVATIESSTSTDTYTYVITYPSSSNTNNWSQVYCYIWKTSDSDDGSAYAGTWPGGTMNYDSSTQAWTYTLTTTVAASDLSIIFNDGTQNGTEGTNKTATLSFSDYATISSSSTETEVQYTDYTITYDAGETTYSAVSCYVYKTTDEGTTVYSEASPGTAMSDDDEDGTWTCTISIADTVDTSSIKVKFTTYASESYTSGTESVESDLTDYIDTDTEEQNPSGTTSSSVSAAGNLYLVGDFFDDSYNAYENKAFEHSFRLDKKTSDTDGTYYSIYIPATLSGVTFNLEMSNGDGTYTEYGCSNNGSNYNFTSSWPSADGTVPTTAADITQNGDSWCLQSAHANTTTDDGTYEFKVWLDDDGNPSTWQMTHITNLRVAYFVQSPGEVSNPVMHVATMTGANGSFKNNYYGYIYLDAGKHAYVVANVLQKDYTTTSSSVMETTTKLHSQGSISDTYGICQNEGNGQDSYSKVYPKYGYGLEGSGFRFSTNESMGVTIEYNPTKGRNDVDQTIAGTVENNTNYFGGALLSSSKTSVTKITSLSIIGEITGGWTSYGESSSDNNELSMTWDDAEGCYYVTLTTTADDGAEKFRFIANNSWKTSFEEDGTAAKTPYKSTTASGNEASEDDPNYVDFLSSSATTYDADNGTDIVFNRPAGVWTIKFYIESETSWSGSSNDDDVLTQTYYYTITGEEGVSVSPVYFKDQNQEQFICTYSNDTTAVNLHDGVKAYVAYKYIGKDDVSSGSTDGTAEGTLYMREMDYVPVNVGVVLIANYSDVSEYIDSETELTSGSSTYKFTSLLTKRSESSATSESTYPTAWTKYDEYYAADTCMWHNYLRPGTGVIVGDGNASYDNDGDAYERYFGFSLYSKTENYKTESANLTDQDATINDYYGFFRFKSGTTVRKGIAYLYLPTTEEKDGYIFGTLDYNGQILGGVTSSEAIINGSKGIKLVFDDMEGYEESTTTTGISAIQETAVRTYDDAYYTLQGIRVTTPSRGIYIHNGKKIIIR